jgi:hypothetical protein
MIMGDINVHVNASEQDYICNEVDDVLDNFLPSNYIADNIQKSHTIQRYPKLQMSMVDQ